ncbi:MAG: hypothetical protein JO353_12355 [Phycisphaerae bacterium]|nr:hypothetical protein [Phycisphaerae bacterium]
MSVLRGRGKLLSTMASGGGTLLYMSTPHEEKIDKVNPLGIVPSPRLGAVGMLGYLAAAVGITTIIAMPFGLLSLAHGELQGVGDNLTRPILMGALMGFDMAVAVLAFAAGVAACAGKLWSRFGMMLYAILALLIAVIGIWPVIAYVADTADADIGMRHTVQVLIIIKQWIVETPLALGILFTFSKHKVVRAYGRPVMESPDRSHQ